MHQQYESSPRRFLAAVIAFIAVVVVVAIGVETASAADRGNSANAKLCQKDGWGTLVRSDGSSFANQDECVSYAAKGGTLQPKPTCNAGSDNFSDVGEGSQPTTFAGGTIDTAYGTFGGIYIDGATHWLFPGKRVTSFQLTLANPVGSVTLDVELDIGGTLAAYDASNNVVGAAVQGGTNRLTVTSTTNSIKYFTIATSTDSDGFFFTNIVWACAA